MLTKQTCLRCGGTGKFSYNLMHGNMCYGCRGSGFVLVDTVKQEKARRKKEQVNKQREHDNLMRAAIAEIVRSELDSDLGPFPNTEKGCYDRVVACQLAYGKTPGQIVQDRLNSLVR